MSVAFRTVVICGLAASGLLATPHIGPSPAEGQIATATSTLEQFRKLAAERQSRDNRPYGHTSPLGRTSYEKPSVPPFFHKPAYQACTLVTPKNFKYTTNPLVYTSSLEEKVLAFAPKRSTLSSEPVDILVQHTSGFSALLSMKPNNTYLTGVLTPEQDAAFRTSLTMTGQFLFTLRAESNAFDVNAAGDQLEVFAACEAQLAAAPAPAISEVAKAAPEPHPDLKAMVDRGQWQGAITFVANDNWSGKSALHQNYLMDKLMTAPSANTPAVRQQLYLEREMMFRALSVSGKQRNAMTAFVDGIVNEFAPIRSSPSYRIDAATVGECHDRGGTVKSGGCWSN